MLDVSVAVSTHGRPNHVRRLLEALEHQTLDRRRFEVVICDDGSAAAIWQAVQARAAESPMTVRLVRHATNRGAAAGRNSAWRATTAPVVAFTDDDCEPAPGWLEAGLVEVSGCCIVQGRVSPHPEDEAIASGPFSRTIRVDAARFFETCNVFYRCSELEAVGGFSEEFGRGGGEDTDLAMRVLELGAEARFASDALVHHEVRPSSLRAALWSTPRWVTIPLLTRRYPVLRELYLYRRLFWRRSHLHASVALLGILIAAGRWRPGTIVLLIPWLDYRLRVDPLCPSRSGRLRALPGALVLDVFEVVTMVRGSARHRSLVL